MKTAVFLSGGVDSSVAAALLMDQGHQLHAFMHKHWPESRCCSTAGCASAESVAAFLKLPFEIIDVIPEFTEAVVEPYIQGYLGGETPNPCTSCNPKIRFGVVYDKVLQKHPELTHMATGHYVRLTRMGDRVLLTKGKDPDKDQSYMLYGLSQAQLQRCIFPLGDVTKPEVRAIAEEKGIPSAKLPDSQDVCYAVKGHPQFVEDYTGGRGLNVGKLKDEDGKELGDHEGIHRYTIGQRRGLKTALGYPAYVKAIDAETNSVVLGPKESLYRSNMRVRDLQWSAFDTPPRTLRAEIKIRYGSQPVAGQLHWRDDGQVEVLFDEPQFAITSGQRAVFYEGDVVLGGGVIGKIES